MIKIVLNIFEYLNIVQFMFVSYGAEAHRGLWLPYSRGS
jgi:hypothetical protein